jgi:serine protease inhibitor
MKKLIRLFFIIILSACFNSCQDNPLSKNSDDPDNSIREIRDLTELEKAVVEKNNLFAFNVLKKINDQSLNKNVFISPLSLYLALGMAYNGADGTTKQAMASVLELGRMPDQQFNESIKAVTELLLTLDPNVIIKIANSIWIKEGFPVEPLFINTNAEYFNSSVTNLDFNNPNSVSVINNWVAANTAGYIKKIIEVIPPQMVMYLLNAVYFEAKWRYPFNKDDTYNGEFELADGSTKICRMMKQQNMFHFYSDENFSAVDIPYGNSGFSMTLLLPAENIDIETAINLLSNNEWSDIIYGMRNSEIFVSIPKFKFEYEVDDLIEALTQLGMGICFDPYFADFRNINKDGGLYIDEAKHKTYIEVDEEGTKAAAVTSIGFGYTSMPPSIIFNRPFFFAIRENKSQTILFMGKIMDPIYE